MNKLIAVVVGMIILFTSLGVTSGLSTDVTTINIDIVLPPESTTSSYWYFAKPVTEEDKYCLARTIYFEARGEPVNGQYVVAEVVLDRLMHDDYPETICGVVEDGRYHKWNPDVVVRHRCQFSYWCDGKSDIPKDEKAFGVAKYIAGDILTNPRYVREVDYALFYHADYVNPEWNTTVVFVTQIGTHLIYN